MHVPIAMYLASYKVAVLVVSFYHPNFITQSEGHCKVDMGTILFSRKVNE